MRTRDEFRRRWRNHVAGLLALGSGRVRRLITAPFESAAAFGETMNGLGETADTLLDQLYDDLVPKEPLPVKPNGQPAKKV
jgi:hypothetical protein